MKRSYICDKCGVESHVNLGDNPNFYEAVKGIRDDHYKWSPECAATKVQIPDVDDPIRRHYIELS